MSLNTGFLTSILFEIGASEFLPNFIEAGQDDSCIPSFRIAKSVEKMVGLPSELAVQFVEKCRLVAIRSPGLGVQPAGDLYLSISLALFTF